MRSWRCGGIWGIDGGGKSACSLIATGKPKICDRPGRKIFRRGGFFSPRLNEDVHGAPLAVGRDRVGIMGMERSVNDDVGGFKT